MSLDTNTRLIRPAEATSTVLADLHDEAAALVAEAMTVAFRPAVSVQKERLYAGRHRTSEDVATRLRPAPPAGQVLVPLPAREVFPKEADSQQDQPPRPLHQLFDTGLRLLRIRGAR